MLEVSITNTTGDFKLHSEFTAGNEIVGILGPSGCGKSMTLGCIAGLVVPDKGHIRLNGRELFDSQTKLHVPPRHRKIGYVFQHYALFPHLTVAQNIAYGVHRVPRKERQEHIQHMIQKMHLDGLHNRYPSQLSGGQQQRVALARTLITNPELLLLDEPFSAVDNHVKSYLEQELLQLIHNHYTGTVLLVTHNIDEAYRLCNRIIIYDKGRIVQIGSKEDIKQRPVNVSTARITGCKNVIPVDEILSDSGDMIVRCGRFTLRAPMSATIPDSSNLFAAFRSHHVQISSRPVAEENCFPCEIVQVLEGMFHTIFFLRCGELRLQAEMLSENRNHTLVQKYSKVYLYIPREHIFLVNDNSTMEGNEV